jgi:hypothetical protein
MNRPRKFLRRGVPNLLGLRLTVSVGSDRGLVGLVQSGSHGYYVLECSDGKIVRKRRSDLIEATSHGSNSDTDDSYNSERLPVRLKKNARKRKRIEVPHTYDKDVGDVGSLLAPSSLYSLSFRSEADSNVSVKEAYLSKSSCFYAPVSHHSHSPLSSEHHLLFHLLQAAVNSNDDAAEASGRTLLACNGSFRAVRDQSIHPSHQAQPVMAQILPTPTLLPQVFMATLVNETLGRLDYAALKFPPPSFPSRKEAQTAHLLLALHRSV